MLERMKKWLELVGKANKYTDEELENLNIEDSDEKEVFAQMCGCTKCPLRKSCDERAVKFGGDFPCQEHIFDYITGKIELDEGI